MVVIKSFEIKNVKNEGVKINFKPNMKNLIIANTKYGKTLLVNSILATLGSNKDEKIIGINGIKETIFTDLVCQIGDEDFEINAIISEKIGEASSYKVTHLKSGKSSDCVSAEELTDFVFEIIKYPRYITWDGQGRKSMLEDSIAPYYMNQTWDGGIGQSLNLKYKPANRIAVSLAFDSPIFREKLDFFYKNDELIFGMMNYFRINSSKDEIVKVLKNSIVDEEGELNQIFNKKIELENSFLHYRELLSGIVKNHKDEIFYRRNMDVISRLILPSLSLKVGKDTAESTMMELQNLWISTITDIKKNPNYLLYVSKVKEIRSELSKYENTISKLAPNFQISKNYFEHIKKNLKPSDTSFTDEQIQLFENLKETWDDIYSDIRSSYIKSIQKNYEMGKLNVKGFGIEKSTNGTNRSEYIKYTLDYLVEIIGENVFYIWDSIYQNDENKEHLSEAERRLKIINELPVKGIFTSSNYTKETSEFLHMNKEKSNINIIEITEPTIFSKFREYN